MQKPFSAASGFPQVSESRREKYQIPSVCTLDNVEVHFYIISLMS